MTTKVIDSDLTSLGGSRRVDFRMLQLDMEEDKVRGLGDNNSYSGGAGAQSRTMHRPATGSLAVKLTLVLR